jgi:hypothetical protein
MKREAPLPRAKGWGSLTDSVASNPHMPLSKPMLFGRGRGERRLGARKVLKSYCPVCGGFIAASTSRELMRIVERAHGCQQCLVRGNPKH